MERNTIHNKIEICGKTEDIAAFKEVISDALCGYSNVEIGINKIEFETDDTPPLDFYKTIIEQFPDLNFEFFVECKVWDKICDFDLID